MIDRPLFTLAPDNLAIQASFIGGEGWRLRIAVRRGTDPWGDDAWSDYSHLTTGELLDVIDGHLASKL